MLKNNIHVQWYAEIASYLFAGTRHVKHESRFYEGRWLIPYSKYGRSCLPILYNTVLPSVHEPLIFM